MLDGDSAHGNPGEPAGDERAVDTDTDVVDEAAEDELEDAVADPVPEGEDEIEAFTAGTEPDRVSAGPNTVKVEDADEDEVEDMDEDEEEGDEVVEEEDDEVDEEEEEDDDDEDDEEEIATESSDATVLEAELGRAMDRTSTNPANPTSHPPAADEITPPIDGYDALTVPQVIAKAEGLEVGQLNAVLEYERANRNRKTLVAKLTRMTNEL